MTTQPLLPAPVAPNVIERAYIEDSPPGLWPDNQDSNFGIHRKVFCDRLFDVVSQLQVIFNEMFPDTSITFLDEWEEEMGLTVNPPGRTLSQRQGAVSARSKRGAFTRTGRKGIIENYISATFGVALAFGPSGIALGSGVPLHSGVNSLAGTYNIIEDVENFLYHVRILNTITVDQSGLQRELTRLTPAGISFDISYVADPFLTGTLTLSGNEITDARRAEGDTGSVVGHSYDGFLNDSSFGIWEASTNLNPYGGFESSLTGWTRLQGIEVFTRDTANHKFGTACASIQVAGTVNGPGCGIMTSPNIVVLPNTRYQMTMWMKGAVGGERVQIFWHEFQSNGTTSVQFNNSPTITLTTDWQRYVLTGVTAATTGQIVLAVNNIDSLDVTWFVDAVQLENTNCPTPYIHTDGAAQTRAVTRVQAPASLIDAAQGWVATRVRLGWGNSNEPGGGTGYPRLVEWGEFPTFIGAFYNEGIDAFSLSRDDGIDRVDVSIPHLVSPGDIITIVAAWEATRIRISVNGSVFTNLANTFIPTMTDTMFDIATGNGFNDLDGDVLWFACGTGPLTDADAATLYSLGNTAPGQGALPDAAGLTAAMSMNTSGYDDYSSV